MKAYDLMQRMPLILASAAVLSLVPSCGDVSVSSRATVTVEDLSRKVVAEASGTVSLKTEGGSTAEIRTDGHTFRVEAERILVDGKEVLAIARSCREVKITVDGATFEIQVDGDESPFAGQLK